ncbi:hypothetical protein Cfor_11199 [Coptotermes formosanus]|uniref:Uncharacterized protein n=1 Tax=Coptotermes formosanus TaxID=36987 RepID=A0A6L2Q2X8_COPFO|nr:hypothetical protein Cfor_11199 [Coptotermes formosanus]
MGRRCGMEMNVEETRVMRISRQPSPIQIMIDQKQLKSVKYFNCLESHGKSSIEQEEYFTRQLDLKLRKKLVKCYIWSIAFYGAETWTLREVDQKCLESFETWPWGRIQKISWTDRMRNEALHRVKEERNILQTIKRR